jgi:hypothetical protein
MNPHPDSFENALSALQRRPLPAAWRDELLQAAAQKPRVAHTPRWLLAGWSLAWAATLVLYFTTPAEPTAPQAAHMSNAAAPLLWQQRVATIEALLAAN